MKNKKIKEGYQKELRRLWIKENLQAWLIPLPIILLVAVIMFMGYTSYIVDSTEDVTGIVTGMGAWETKEGNTVYMTAEMEDGTKVRAYVPAYLRIEKGRKAVLIAKKGKFFGGVRYSFKGYADD